MKYQLFILIVSFTNAQSDSNSVHTVIAGQGRPANEEELRWQRKHNPGGISQYQIPDIDDANRPGIEPVTRPPYGSIDIEAVRMRENDQGGQDRV